MSDFQNLDEQDYPESRLQKQLEAERIAEAKRVADEIDANERRNERIRAAESKTTKISDTSIDIQTLDIAEFPVTGSDAPPPKILVDVGDIVGGFERTLGGASTKMRKQASGLRFTEITLQDSGEQVKIKRTSAKSTTRKIDISTDIQNLDIDTFPVGRPVGMTTPQIINELGGLSLKAGAGFYDALTMPLRPSLIGETVKTGVGVVFSQKVRQEIATMIKSDPAGFAAELGGGFLGGRLLGKGLGKVKSAYTRAKYATDLPDEAFFHPAARGRLDIPEPTEGISTFKGYKPLKVAIKDSAGYEYVSIGPDDVIGMTDELGTTRPPSDIPVRYKLTGGRYGIDIDQTVKSGSSALDDLYKGAPDEAAFYNIGDELGAVKTKGLIHDPMKPFKDRPVTTGGGAQKLTTFAEGIGERGFTQTKTTPRANIWGVTETSFINRARGSLGQGSRPPKLTGITNPLSAVGMFAGISAKSSDLLPNVTQKLDLRSKALQGIGLGLDEGLLPKQGQDLGQGLYTDPITFVYPKPDWPTPPHPPITEVIGDTDTTVIPNIFTRTHTRTFQIPRQTQKQEQMLKLPAPTKIPIPHIPGFTGPPRKRRKRLALPLEKKPKKGARGAANIFAGELRKYNLKDPRKILEL